MTGTDAVREGCPECCYPGEPSCPECARVAKIYDLAHAAGASGRDRLVEVLRRTVTALDGAMQMYHTDLGGDGDWLKDDALTTNCAEFVGAFRAARSALAD